MRCHKRIQQILLPVCHSIVLMSLPLAFVMVWLKNLPVHIRVVYAIALCLRRKRTLDPETDGIGIGVVNATF